MNRQTLIRELIDRVDRGPSVLNLVGVPIACSHLSSPDCKRLAKHLQQAYREWADTWILPQLNAVKASWCPRKPSKVKPDRKRGA